MGNTKENKGVVDETQVNETKVEKTVDVENVEANENAKTVTVESKAKKMMERYGVSEIYANKKGEFFLDKHLAVNSENGCEDSVQTYFKK